MLTKETIDKFNKSNFWPYSDKDGNIVNVPNEWWKTEEGRKKIESMGIKKENVILFWLINKESGSWGKG